MDKDKALLTPWWNSQATQHPAVYVVKNKLHFNQLQHQSDEHINASIIIIQ